MSLQATNLIIQAAPLPVTFKGTPQAWLEEYTRRLRIVSPSGTNFIFIGDSEPASNVGPWLKNGTQWYVWDTDINRYVPLDISESDKDWFWMSNSTPPDVMPPVWLKTTGDDPNYGAPISWHIWDGTLWQTFVGLLPAGPTASRPASAPTLQLYYDTDIECLIWWERALWRTVDGVPGDIKFVAFENLADALLANPGWDLLGSGNQAWRGRHIMQAAKDGGGGPASVSVGTNIAQRESHEVFGETQGIMASGSLTITYPPSIAMWALIKL